MDKAFDRMKLDCLWCGHKWKFSSPVMATSKQIDDWFADYQKLHYEVCKIYKILKNLNKGE